jgi:hypothetical protein
LKVHLDEIAKIPSSAWMAGLTQRKIRELEFHNRDRDKQLIEEYDKDTYD